MRLNRLCPIILALCVPVAAIAQTHWLEYTNREDLFTVALPAQPTVESFTYTTEYGSKLPARRYSATDGATRYTMTVVNMTTTDRKPNGHGIEMRGSIQFAATTLRRTGAVTTDNYAELLGVPGQELQITLPNKTRKYSGIYLLNKHLYIMEALAPANAAPPLLYLASLGFHDAAGNDLRYADTNDAFPNGRAPVQNAGGGGGAAAGKDAGAGGDAYGQ